jgi:hypothetical protein
MAMGKSFFFVAVITVHSEYAASRIKVTVAGFPPE